MHKLCLLLVASGAFFPVKSVGSITGDGQAVVATPNAGTVPRVDDASSESPELLRSHDRAVDKTALTTADQDLKSNGSTVSSSERDLEDRNAFSGLAQKIKQGISRGVTAALIYLPSGSRHVLKSWQKQKLTPVQAARVIGIDRSGVSPKKLRLWIQHARWHQSTTGKALDYDAAYRVFKGTRGSDKVFERLTALRNVKDAEVGGLTAYMYNKLAKELTHKLGNEASGWMAGRWMKMGLHPEKVAKMLGKGDDLVSTGLYSAAQWVGYVKMLQKKHSKLAIDTEKATNLLVGQLNKKAKVPALRAVWPDHPIFSLAKKKRRTG
ncbi:unnamed protein product [Hyaloperonospora brassicae]|uniref:RxLR effector candidate protein n=1 Tax=Hyaloperonospora brassicae TaxID=162125 RepID=A0AAV0TCA4_HYABA|nr:unnamed protein product [Hyaloperonospora brassicae]